MRIVRRKMVDHRHGWSRDLPREAPSPPRDVEVTGLRIPDARMRRWQQPTAGRLTVAAGMRTPETNLRQTVKPARNPAKGVKRPRSRNAGRNRRRIQKPAATNGLTFNFPAGRKRIEAPNLRRIPKERLKPGITNLRLPGPTTNGCATKECLRKNVRSSPMPHARRHLLQSVKRLRSNRGNPRSLR